MTTVRNHYLFTLAKATTMDSALVGWLLSVLLAMADGSGQSCQDLDPQACSTMAKQNPNMCMDQTLATAVCPKFCHRCPVTCYNCITHTRELRGCNTITCSSEEVCMVDEKNQLLSVEGVYNLRCASKSACNGIQSNDVSSTTIRCCSDDRCNTPNLILDETTSTPISTTASPLPVNGDGHSRWVEFEGSLYFISDNVLDWSSAQKLCLSVGGHLVTIKDQREETFIIGPGLSLNGSFWIGGSDLNVESKFEWVTGEPFLYTNWAPHEPNEYGDGEDCIELTSGLTGVLRWNDKWCGASQRYICEKPRTSGFNIAG